MKTFFKIIGVFTLVFFSFFYTEKVINVIHEQDEIMIKLNEIKDDYIVDSIDATIKDNTIIPGLNGKEIDIDKSYKNMKKIGVFNDNLIIYKDIVPSINLNNNKDKYIVGGNSTSNNISFVFKINNSNDRLYNIIKEKNISVNLFVDYDYLINNIDMLKDNSNYEYYTYGNNGIYRSDIITLSNNIINRKSNIPLYCLCEDTSNNTLEVCADNDMHTILPSIINANYSDIKLNIKNGSIISFTTSSGWLKELPIIIDYVISKGYDIVPLSKLLSEKI